MWTYDLSNLQCVLGIPVLSTPVTHLYVWSSVTDSGYLHIPATEQMILQVNHEMN